MTSPLISRAGWGARAPRSTPPTIRNQGQTGHYGGNSPWGNADRSSPERFAATTDHNRCATILRAWQAWHMDGQGWNDCGYNSAVCPHSYRYDIRGVGRRSAAQGTNDGNNRSCATVYIAGGHDPLTDEAKRAFHAEAVRFGAPLRWNHGDWKATPCAGPSFRAWQAAGFPPPAPTPNDQEVDMRLLHPHDTPGDSGSIWLLNGGRLGRVADTSELADLQKLHGVQLERIGAKGWAAIKRTSVAIK